jgi:hypothetical protein
MNNAIAFARYETILWHLREVRAQLGAFPSGKVEDIEDSLDPVFERVHQLGYTLRPQPDKP